MSPASRLAGRAAALACALGLSGCFIMALRDLPPHWPRPLERATAVCPDVSGRWEAWSAEDPYTWEREPLAPLVGAARAAQATPGAKRPPEDWVELAQPDADTLTVRSGLTGEGGGEAVTLRRGTDFECEGGALQVSSSDDWGNANICAAKSWWTHSVWRDAQGGLVARSSDRSLCVGFIVNGVAMTTEWARFLPAPP